MCTLARVGALLIMSQVPCVADLLWENGSFDGVSGLQSLRRPGVDTTWVADDFLLGDPVRIERALGEFYVDPPDDGAFELADVGVWTQPIPGGRPGEFVVEIRDLPISFEKIGEGFGYDILAVSVDDLAIELEPGDYFFSMRLVHYTYSGRAWLATTGNGMFKGHGPGWFWRWDGWHLAGNFMNTGDSDFAFRLEGIPEPTTAMLLLFALAAAARPRVATYTA